MKQVLVTGGAGFIGANVVRAIEASAPEAAVTVLDDFRATSFQNLLGTRADVLAFNAARPDAWSALADRPFDTIIHLASITDTTVMDQRLMMEDNVEGFRRVLDFARVKKARVVYASSAAVYGSRGDLMREEDGGSPNNIYGFSKWVLENLARFYKDLPQGIVGLRFFNVFGPYEEYKGAAASMTYQLYHQMIAGKRPRIFFDGEQKRDFVYVRDVVSAVLAAARPAGPGNAVCNVGSGQATSFNQLVAYLNEALGTRLEPEYFKNPYSFYQDFTQADISHTARLLGYKPAFTTREGVLDYVRRYLQPRQQPQA